MKQFETDEDSALRSNGFAKAIASSLAYLHESRPGQWLKRRNTNMKILFVKQMRLKWKQRHKNDESAETC